MEILVFLTLPSATFAQIFFTPEKGQNEEYGINSSLFLRPKGRLFRWAVRLRGESSKKLLLRRIAEYKTYIVA